MTSVNKEKGNLSIHTENIFPIIKKWLYSEHDIFIRELISNAIDATSKRKAVDESFKEEDQKIEIKFDKKKDTIEIIDHGIGMTKEEVEKYINQIAFSGAEDFVKKYKDQENIIGHFGLGFYSSFMVSDKVTIDTLSWQEGTEPAFWECDGNIEYSMGEGKRKEVGTTITLHLTKDNKEYLEEHKIKELVEKYSNFVPYPIYLNDEKEKINIKSALWNKTPKDVTPEEYKEFYKDLFHDYNEPLFWIHLNVEYPFNLKGILYFPKIGNTIDLNKGKVKLFCNNVFVADDLKGFIPEFLLLLRGGIDIPDIPLNVSRSFLQHDKEVQKISKYIIKKIADSLKEIFKEDRKKYEGFWEDINHFIKYGIISDEKFYDAMKDHIIFKTTNDDYVTIDEYLSRNKSDEKPQKVYYATNDKKLVSYLNLMKEQGVEVIYSNSVLDNHLFQHLEMKNADVTFVRIDSEINENIVNKEENDENKDKMKKIKEIFTKFLNSKTEASFDKESYKKFIEKYPTAATELASYITTKDDFTHINPYEIPIDVKEKIGNEAFDEILSKMHVDVTVDVKNLKSEKIPTMIVFNEFMRRYQEMNYMMQNSDFDMLKNHTLMVNYNNPIVNKIVALYDKDDIEKAKLVTEYIHDLALIEQKQFVGEELTEFIDKSTRILELIK